MRTIVENVEDGTVREVPVVCLDKRRVVVRVNFQEIVFSRNGGWTIRGDKNWALTDDELKWYCPQNKVPTGRDVEHF